jgi:hypothetical protein
MSEKVEVKPSSEKVVEPKPKSIEDLPTGERMMAKLAARRLLHIPAGR